MNSEIDKLLAYCSGQVITEDSVKQVTSYAREANIFALVDSILEGRTKVAQQLLHRLLRDGASPSYILAMITRQLRLIVMTKDLGLILLSRQGNTMVTWLLTSWLLS